MCRLNDGNYNRFNSINVKRYVDTYIRIVVYCIMFLDMNNILRGEAILR